MRYACMCYDILYMMHGCEILLTTAGVLHSNVLDRENKSLSVDGGWRK